MEHEEIRAKVLRIMRECRMLPDELSDQQTLESLGFDSLDLIVLIDSLEDEFTVIISIEEGYEIGGSSSVRDVISFMDTLLSRQRAQHVI